MLSHHNSFLAISFLLVTFACSTNVSDNDVLETIKDVNFESVKSILEENKEISFVKVDTFMSFSDDYKWVGAILADNGRIYGIPTGETSILEINPQDKRYCTFGKLHEGQFKWTGGALASNGHIYGFPRSSNTFLDINPDNQTVKEVPFNRQFWHVLSPQFGEDHHYGGTMIGNKMYLAPRNWNSILIIDVKDGSTEEIETIGGVRYSGTVYHPNGNIYFAPERGHSGDGRIMKYNIETKDLTYFKDTISCSCFGMVVYPKDINIYSFSALTAGILKIDIKKEKAEMIHREIGTGWYGTKLGINGKLYSVCGDNTNVVEYDPITDEIRIVATIDDRTNTKDYNKAKCAGAAVLEDGSIWCVPAFGRFGYIYRFDSIPEKTIPAYVYKSIYYNNY